MNIIDALILLIIGFIAYKYFTTRQSDESFEEDLDDSQSETHNNEIDEDYIVENPKVYIDKILKSKKKVVINPYFTEMQYHKDYRDTANAFNIIVPNQRQVFNRSDKPLVEESVPEVKEVKRLIGSFIKEVNKIVDEKIKPEIELTGWNNALPDKKIKSGWEKQQESLGLPTSLYTDDMDKGPIKLVKIDHLEKYSTDDQIRYVAFLIVKKKNVDDQMVLRVSFVLDTKDVNLDREFFDEEKSVYESAVIIEEVFVIGFLTRSSYGRNSALQQLQNYDGITNNGITNEKEVMNQLVKKKKMYEDECYM